MSHYTTPMVLQQAAIPIQVGHGGLAQERMKQGWWNDTEQLLGSKESGGRGRKLWKHGDEGWRLLR